MAYAELIKNFGRIRDYMREFYVYGFKSREAYDQKSGRSYDNERRRIASYLSGYMQFRRAPNGKTVFLSIDSRAVPHNPLYQALKAKSFTSGDITLHFILLDLLYSPNISLTLHEITERIDADYLSHFHDPLLFDESTIRKKLKEYGAAGLITKRTHGRQVLYSRADAVEWPEFSDALHFFSEVAPCGAVGSFLLDQYQTAEGILSFKHHYITHALDSEVLCQVLDAISQQRRITMANHSRRADADRVLELTPLRVFASVQNGRQYVLGYDPVLRQIKSYRLDYIRAINPGVPAPDFDGLRAKLDRMRRHMWGVVAGKDERKTEHVAFTIWIGAGEEHIARRLQREKRCGTVERLDHQTCRFTADVYDTNEMVPWIRTFLCRILQMNFSNRTVENQFKADLEAMYQLYEIEGSPDDAVS